MKKVGLILLSLIIIAFNIIIGSTESGINYIFVSTSLILTAVYLLILKIKYKNKIFFKNKTDLLIFIFFIVILFPLLFKTYVSLENTINFTIKYYYIYSIYILARNVIKDKKDIKIIINVILISAFIPSIIRFDILHTKLLMNWWEKLKIVYRGGEEFSGTFGYANTLAAYMLLCIFFSLYKFKESNRALSKIISIMFILIYVYIILITQCRFVQALLFIFIMINVIKKNLSFIIDNYKKVFVLGLIITVIFEIAINCTLRVTKPIIIKDELMTKVIDGNFEKGKNYKLSFGFSSQNISSDKVTLTIKEINDYSIDIIGVTKNIDILNGYYTINYTPVTDLNRIKVEIKNESGEPLSFNDFYLNDKEYIVEYKYYTYQFGSFLQHYSLYGRSIQQRKHVYGDCFKIFKDQPYFGHGGNAWRMLSSSYREYFYSVKETHSYLFELLISYGLIGLFSFMSFIIYLFYKIIKSRDKSKMIIGVGLLLFMLHSVLFDFSMSFILIQLIVYITIAILSYDQEDDMPYTKYLGVIPSILIILLISICVLESICKYSIKDNKKIMSILPFNINSRYYYTMEKYKNGDYDYNEVLSNMKVLMNNEPYYFQVNMYLYYFNVINNNVDNLSSDELNDYLNFVINHIYDNKKIGIYDYDQIMERSTLFNSVIEFYMTKISKYDKNNDSERIKILRNACCRLKAFVKKEYSEAINEIISIDKTGKTKEQALYVLSEYNKINNNINYCN